MKRRRLIFGILWILSLTAISFYGGAVSYGLFFGLSLIHCISFIYLLLIYFQFRIYQEIESRNMVCKQPMPYYFVLQNSGCFAFAGINVHLFSGLSYVLEMPDDEVYQLLPGDEYLYRTHLICKYRGEYEVGVKEVILTDFFRLFSVRYRCPSTLKALVYPRIIEKAELNSMKELAVFWRKDTPLLQSEPDVLVRDYAAGDALKLIHWKATARERKLKTRSLIGEEKQRILFFYDTKRYSRDPYEYLPLENQILETILALGIYFAKQNTPFSVFCGQNGLCMQRVHGMQDYEGFYQKTARTVFSGEENVEELFDQVAAQGRISESSVCIGIVHEMNDFLLDRAKQLETAGIFTVWYVVTDQNMEKYLRQSSSRCKIISLPVEAELEEIL